MPEKLKNWLINSWTKFAESRFFRFGVRVKDGLYWVLLVGGLPLCIFWSFHVPLAGYAVGLLGAVGVFVALRGDARLGGHKPIWALIETEGQPIDCY